MGRKQEQEEKQEQKQQSKSLRSKAVHFVSDLTTVLLNPISDKPSKPPPKPSSHDDVNNSENSHSDIEEGSNDSVDGPDTSSFTAFLYSLLASSESRSNSNFEEKIDSDDNLFKPSSEPTVTRENAKKKSLFSRGKQSLGKAFYQAAKLGGFRNQGPKGSSDMVVGNGSNSKTSVDEGIPMQTLNESLSSENLPETSEPSLLLSEKTRSVLYAALPVIVQGRKWMLLYSTWRHGISLSTLYRRSMLWPGLSLLVVGDRNGAVFGGLVEAPLRPTNRRRYQGSNSSFVFTNTSGHPLIFRPTGMNRYFTLCSTDYLAMGGGGHFALYLDGELSSGSSSSSETYGNPCLARTEDFDIKEVELWGFVYASKFDEMIALSRTEAPGICHW
ncbi:TLD domain-containing protein 2 [Sesamum indicum]|uniref:Oxidation resistance protein 1 n=1 Tax=Sesamum indicum TaxID=4182 RepID=A0A6I9TWK9_SESIN|nr:TLD domain-containing protein 2 [Sesamum indicum]